MIGRELTELEEQKAIADFETVEKLRNHFNAVFRDIQKEKTNRLNAWKRKHYPSKFQRIVNWLKRKIS